MASWGRWSALAVLLVTATSTYAGGTATLALTVSPSAAVAPASVRLTAAVNGGSLSGSIVFVDGTLALGSASIKHGKAEMSTTLDVGIHRIMATYSGGGKTIESPAVSVVVDTALSCE